MTWLLVKDTLMTSNWSAVEGFTHIPADEEAVGGAQSNFGGLGDAHGASPRENSSVDGGCLWRPYIGPLGHVQGPPGLFGASFRIPAVMRSA